MKRKFLTVVAVAASASLVLAACGSTTSNEASDATAVEEEVEQVEQEIDELEAEEAELEQEVASQASDQEAEPDASDETATASDEEAEPDASDETAAASDEETEPDASDETAAASDEETEPVAADDTVTAEDQEAADEVAELIDAIYVQEWTEDTWDQCEEAKAAWDALTKTQKELVEGEDADPEYFGRDTGDSMLDDPRNQDDIGENEILVVSFGTSFNDSRATDIKGIEDAIQEAFPDWTVRRAFTAQIIINHVYARNGEQIDNMDQALQRAVDNGVKNLVVQPTHLMHGAEYDEMVEAVEEYADQFESVVIAEPLLGEVGDDATVVNEDKQIVAEEVVAAAVESSDYDSLEDAAADGTAFVLMGHGTSHTANVTYDQMQTQMENLGYDNVFIGTVEGEPEDTECSVVIDKVHDAGYTNVVLRPLMVVAGDHANNDMAGEDEDSWVSQFITSGYFDSVDAQIEGMGRVPAIEELYVQHTADAMGEEPVAADDTVTAEDQEAADEVAELIDAIYVQEWTQDTWDQCEEAKEAWDALTNTQKELVEGEDADPEYFGRDTGDSMLDDPRNQDDIGENEILVVSFGTSFNDSRSTDIKGIEDAIQEAYPDWTVRRAFTAQIIINHVYARNGEQIDNMDQALQRAVDNGVKNLVVQPTHLMHGAEYDEMVEAVEEYADQFESVVIAEPLLGEVGDDATVVNQDKEDVAIAVVAAAVADAGYDSLEDAAADGTAFVLMGHGTSHTANVTYDQMQTEMENLGYDNVFIGTVEGEPEDTECSVVIDKAHDAGYTNVVLRPLMVVAGDHANNDMAGDDEDSWKSQFEDSGYFDSIETQIAGLGRLPEVEDKYVAHIEEALNNTGEAVEAAETADTADAAALEDGIYTVTFDTDSSMFHANESTDGRVTLTVEDGQMTVHVPLVSENIVNLFYGTADDAQADGAELIEPVEETVTYSDGTSEEVYAFDIPVPALDEEFDVAIIGTKGTWYDHKVSVSDPEPAE